MDPIDRVIDNITALGTSLFAIRRPGEKPIPKDPEFVLLSLILAEQLPLSEIGRRLHRSKPCITALVGRLAREGKVRRIPSKEDHRITRIAITADGRRALAAKRNELANRVRACFAPLTADDLERFDACLVELNAIISRMRMS